MIRVGTIIAVTNAYNNYQKKIKEFKQNSIKAATPQEKQYWEDSVNMTEMEVQEFLQIILPDPEPSKTSPYLAKGYDSLTQGAALDMQA